MSATIVAAMLLVFGQEASAAVPNIVREYSTPVSFQVADCGAFQIIGSWTVNIRDVTYFDASGTPVRDDFQAHFKGTLANSMTGKYIDDSGALRTTSPILSLARFLSHGYGPTPILPLTSACRCQTRASSDSMPTETSCSALAIRIPTK